MSAGFLLVLVWGTFLSILRIWAGGTWYFLLHHFNHVHSSNISFELLSNLFLGMFLVWALHVHADVVIFVLIYLQQQKINAEEAKDKDAWHVVSFSLLSVHAKSMHSHFTGCWTIYFQTINYGAHKCQIFQSHCYDCMLLLLCIVTILASYGSEDSRPVLVVQNEVNRSSQKNN